MSSAENTAENNPSSEPQGDSTADTEQDLTILDLTDGHFQARDVNISEVEVITFSPKTRTEITSVYTYDEHGQVTLFLLPAHEMPSYLKLAQAGDETAARKYLGEHGMKITGELDDAGELSVATKAKLQGIQEQVAPGIFGDDDHPTGMYTMDGKTYISEFFNVASLSEVYQRASLPWEDYSDPIEYKDFPPYLISQPIIKISLEGNHLNEPAAHSPSGGTDNNNLNVGVDLPMYIIDPERGKIDIDMKSFKYQLGDQTRVVLQMESQQNESGQNVWVGELKIPSPASGGGDESPEVPIAKIYLYDDNQLVFEVLDQTPIIDQLQIPDSDLELGKTGYPFTISFDAADPAGHTVTQVIDYRIIGTNDAPRIEGEVRFTIYENGDAAVYPSRILADISQEREYFYKNEINPQGEASLEDAVQHEVDGVPVSVIDTDPTPYEIYKAAYETVDNLLSSSDFGKTWMINQREEAITLQVPDPDVRPEPNERGYQVTDIDNPGEMLHLVPRITALTYSGDPVVLTDMTVEKVNQEVAFVVIQQSDGKIFNLVNNQYILQSNEIKLAENSAKSSDMEGRWNELMAVLEKENSEVSIQNLNDYIYQSINIPLQIVDPHGRSQVDDAYLTLNFQGSDDAPEVIKPIVIKLDEAGLTGSQDIIEHTDEESIEKNDFVRDPDSTDIRYFLLDVTPSAFEYRYKETIASESQTAADQALKEGEEYQPNENKLDDNKPVVCP